MGFEFRKATRTSARLRLALIGPAGTGKTYSALAIAGGLGKRVAVIDSEHGSASKYAGDFAFDVLELDSFAPKTYVEAMEAAVAAGYDVIVVDSLSHAWMGKDGALEMVDRAAKRSGGSNTFGAWRDVTPHHNALVEAMIACRAHLIVTMRAKTEYVQEKDERGRTQVRKVGLAPVQRDGLEYEFDVVGDMTAEHDFVVSKTRCSALADQVIHKPGAKLAATLRAWLTDVPAPAVAAPSPAERDWPRRIVEARQADKPGSALVHLGKELASAELNGARDAILSAYGEALASWLATLADPTTLEQAATTVRERVPEGVLAGAVRARLDAAVNARREALAGSSSEQEG